jgi:hypothetical protein
LWCFTPTQNTLGAIEMVPFGESILAHFHLMESVWGKCT